MGSHLEELSATRSLAERHCVRSKMSKPAEERSSQTQNGVFIAIATMPGDGNLQSHVEMNEAVISSSAPDSTRTKCASIFARW